jgi:zinc/manganese transport system permease protein
MSHVLDWLLAPLQYHYVWRGLAMALLLGVAGGVAGSVLLLKRMVLVADSFGHALLPGVAVAWLLFRAGTTPADAAAAHTAGPGLGALFLGAAAAGVIAIGMSTLVQRNTRLKEDAAFGALFVLCMALGIALMRYVASPGDLLNYLFGNILGITAADLRLVAAAAILTVGGATLGYRLLLVETFDPIFHRACGGRGSLVSFAVLLLTAFDLIAALQAVGVVLALGMFILPAATAYLWCDRFARMLVFAGAWGATGATLGFYASLHLDLPPGPCMVGALGAGFVFSLLAGPYGVLARLLTPRHRHHQEDAEIPCERTS